MLLVIGVFVGTLVVIFLVWSALLILYFFISHKVRKKIAHPYIESIIVSAITDILLLLLMFHNGSSGGESALAGVGMFVISMGPGILLGSLVSSLVIAMCYKDIVFSQKNDRM